MPYGFSESVMEAADNLFSQEGRTMKPEDYIGKQVSVGSNGDFCPRGTFKCVGADMFGTLDLEDPEDIENPWKCSMKYATVI